MVKTRANEREFQGEVGNWIKAQISHGGLAFAKATTDSSLYGLPTVKFPDVLLTLDFECNQPFCGWELKTPTTNVRDKELLSKAVEKAHLLNAKYFVTWNMQTAIIWRTPEKVKATVCEEDKVRELGPYMQIDSVDAIRDPVKSLVLENVCALLLQDLDKLYHNENVNLPVADATVFVGLVAKASENLSGALLKDINKARANKSFDKRLNAWAKKQGVSRYDQDYYITLAQQIAYKIIGKILFYMTLRRYNLGLPRMDLATTNYKAATKKMRSLFQRGLEIDYQAIFEADITDEIKLSRDTAKIVIGLTENLSHWSFELMPLDVIGNVFEKLIPEEARHSLGQYFTPDRLVDLIISFCLRSGDDFVMDPTCGTGTFLIRSYNRLRWKCLRIKPHRKLLEQVWGFDISGFPAELATINLYRQDFGDYANFPRVLSKDFFDVMPGDSFEFPPPKKTVKTGERVKTTIPKFDALVGNFPFIRQELIERVEKGYKKKLEDVLFESWIRKYPALFKNRVAGKKQNTTHDLQLSGQADIYAYLFFHAAAHLKEGGRMGFVTSNSWLDVAYGYELQKFFLSKFKIIAICESRCEPWFEQSSVNTVFTILERSDDTTANNDNLVRFVKLKKPLDVLFPKDAVVEAQERWIGYEQFVERIESIEATGKVTKDSGCKEFKKISSKFVSQPRIISYEDEDVRMRLIKQADLTEQVKGSGQTVKWGQYLRGPDIYFEIMEKCADKFVPLGEVADIRRGITTGINEFFYLTDDQIEHWGIEKRFLKPVIKSPKECEGIKLKRNKLSFWGFFCHEDKSDLRGTKALKYIKWGEKQKTKSGRLWPEVESVKDRKRWYELPKRKPGQILLPMTTGENLRVIVNKKSVQVDHRLFEVLCKDESIVNGLKNYLNSGIAFLCNELMGRANLGDGALEIEGIDWKRIFVPEKEILLRIGKNAGELFESLCRRKVRGIKTESKRKDRIAFEESVLASLGLPKKSAREILGAVVGLVEERYTLPKLRNKKQKNRVAQDYAKLSEEVSEEVLADGPRIFPEGFVAGWGRMECKEITLCAGTVKLGASFFDKQEICDEDGGHLMDVASRDEGKFIVYAKKRNEFVVKVPESLTVIKKAVHDYENYLRDLKDRLYVGFMEKCGDRLVSENLTRKVFEDFRLPDMR